MKEYQETLYDLQVLKELLVIDCNKAGNEAISLSNLNQHIQKLTHKSREVLNYLANLSGVKVTEILPDQFRLKRDVISGKYAVLADKVVYKPIGFTGKVLDFAEVLDAHADAMLECQDTIKAARKIFAGYINEPEELTKVTSAKLPKLVKVKDVTKDFAPFFEGAEGVDREAFGNLYARFADYNKTSEILVDLSKKFKGVNVKDMKDEADSLYNILDMLDKKIVEHNIKLSPSSAKAIAGVIYNIADWLGIYSVYITKLIALANSHRDTAQKLNSFF